MTLGTGGGGQIWFCSFILGLMGISSQRTLDFSAVESLGQMMALINRLLCWLLPWRQSDGLWICV